MGQYGCRQRHSTDRCLTRQPRDQEHDHQYQPAL